MSRRRSALLAAGLALATVWPAAPVGAQEAQEPPPPDPKVTQEDDAAWAGSHLEAPLDAGSHLSATSALDVAGVFRYARDTDVRVSLQVDPMEPIADSCTHDDVAELPAEREPTGGIRGDYRFSIPIELPCNGRYRVRARAAVYWRPEMEDPAATSPDLTADLTIAAPAPDVSGLTITEDDAGVALAWASPESPPPDFLGYEIERTLPGGAPEVLTTLGTDVTSYRDDTAPAPREGIAYRVTALRSGPDGTTMRSAAPAEGTVPPPEPEDQEGVVPPPGSDDDGTDGDDPVVRDQDDEGPVRASPTPVRSPDDDTPSTPDVAPPAPGPVAPADPGAPVTTTTVPYDDGFRDRLPYDPRRSPVAAPLPAEPARGVNRIDYGEDESGPGPGLVVPIAGGLVLLLAAGLLRHLAKLGKPPAEPVPPLPDLTA